MRSILLTRIFRQSKGVLQRELSPGLENCISQTNKLNRYQGVGKHHPYFGHYIFFNSFTLYWNTAD